jgi:hypothetical protein
VPFYLSGPALIEPLAPLPSRHDADNPRLPYVLMLPVLAGAATAVVLYRLQRRLGIHPAAALTAVLFFALGTIHWKYSTVLFSHALSGFLVIGSVYLTLLLADRSSFRPRLVPAVGPGDRQRRGGRVFQPAAGRRFGVVLAGQNWPVEGLRPMLYPAQFWWLIGSLIPLLIPGLL